MADKPTPTPSDAELKTLWQQHAADIGGIFHYARAVLAKWGTPQPVVRGPLTRQQLREAFYSETACTLGGDVDFAEKVCRVVEKAHGIKGGQHG